MQHATKPPLTREGQSIPFSVNGVLIELVCVKFFEAYKVRISHDSFGGAEIPELSRSYPTEAQARSAARNATVYFAAGNTVQQALDVIYAAQPVERTVTSPVEALDEAIARRLGGGHAQPRAGLASLTAAREALDTPAEREQREALAARINADLDASGLYEPAPTGPRSWADIRAEFRATHPQIPAPRRRRR